MEKSVSFDFSPEQPVFPCKWKTPRVSTIASLNCFFVKGYNGFLFIMKSNIVMYMKQSYDRTCFVIPSVLVGI